MRVAPTLAFLLALGCSLDSEALGTGGPNLGDGTSSTGGLVSSSGPPATGTTGDASTGEPASTSSTSTGDASSSSGGESDGTTGDPGMDASLLARWWVNEAASGQTPILLADDASDPLDLPIAYVGAMPVFTTVDGNRGLSWDAAELDGRPLIPIIGSKIETELGGRTHATVELVITPVAFSGSTSRFLHIGTGSGDDLAIGAPAFDSLQVRWRGAPTMHFDAKLDTTRQVIHVVVDTTQPMVTDRVLVYVNGVPLPHANAEGPDRDAGLPLQASSALTLGNRSDGQRSFQGSLQYAAIYLEPFKPSRVGLAVAALKSSDDGP
ncbi:MAG: hypothetical protein H6712_09355 [Myxococcales bacterium]|nr:hypothetical protein [Myxococcales bacterium]MCB9714049.1 hypothetical protein [Myxococcales bacterium]